MQFDDEAKLDPSQVEDVRATGPKRGGGGMPGCGTVPFTGKGGGCLLGLFALAAVFVFTVDPLRFLGDDPTSSPSPARPSTPVHSTGDLASRCRTGADADQSEDCRAVGVVNSVQAYWNRLFNERGQAYSPAKTVLFSRSVNTACGYADASVGPFYCPGDQRVYLDLLFFNTLQRDFGAAGGPFAQAYVIAHEYGHHIQNLTGTMNRVGGDRQGATSGSVRLELQADCYAGVWAKKAVDTGFYRVPFTREDIAEALNAASAVGDDTIQERVQGRVDPEGFTHGTSAQRERWFSTGYETGDPRRCDTFSGVI
ncbi:KPN_02809 family neutral zinc metallopeptidase [Sinosporangium siamense]|nr:neutral zinc metallopeptidase [Sinosporangium siamense]